MRNILPALFLCAGCSVLASTSAGPSADLGIPSATFVNDAGEKITLSRKALWIGGKVIPGKDCSSENYLCTLYDHLLAFIVPKKCTWFSTFYGPYPWRSGRYTAKIASIDPHKGDTEMLSNVSNKLSYVINPSDGVVDLRYDPTGRVNGPEGEEVPASVASALFYRRVSGMVGAECR